MQPTDNDGSPVPSTTPSSGTVWTDEEWNEFVQTFAENLRDGILQNQAAESQPPPKSLFGRGKDAGSLPKQ